MTTTQRVSPDAAHRGHPRSGALSALAALLLLLAMSACASHRPPVEQRAIGQRNRLEQPAPQAPRQGAPTPSGQGAPAGHPSFSAAESAVAKARSVVGTPYRYGGSTPAEGFDCSGLLIWIYSTHGVDLPRTSWEISRAGRAVPPSDMRPGDLVIFDLGRDKPSLHVAIATGAGTFIHSPSSGGRVREESLAEPYWARRIHAVRRVLD